MPLIVGLGDPEAMENTVNNDDTIRCGDTFESLAFHMHPQLCCYSQYLTAAIEQRSHCDTNTSWLTAPARTIIHGSKFPNVMANIKI